MDIHKLAAKWEEVIKLFNWKSVPEFWSIADMLLRFSDLILDDANHFKHVEQFHQKFGHLVHRQPVYLTQRKLLERIKFMQEELDEFTKACGFKRVQGEFNSAGMWVDGDYYENTGVPQNLPEQADALIDICYVAKGTGVMLGLPWDELWNDVQRANMAKVCGVGKRGNLVDCIKPEGWQPPNTVDILLNYGWQPSDYLDKSKHKDDDVHLKHEDR